MHLLNYSCNIEIFFLWPAQDSPLTVSHHFPDLVYRKLFVGFLNIMIDIDRIGEGRCPEVRRFLAHTLPAQFYQIVDFLLLVVYQSVKGTHNSFFSVPEYETTVGEISYMPVTKN